MGHGISIFVKRLNVSIGVDFLSSSDRFNFFSLCVDALICLSPPQGPHCLHPLNVKLFNFKNNEPKLSSLMHFIVPKNRLRQLNIYILMLHFALRVPQPLSNHRCPSMNPSLYSQSYFPVLFF